MSPFLRAFFCAKFTFPFMKGDDFMETIILGVLVGIITYCACIGGSIILCKHMYGQARALSRMMCGCKKPNKEGNGIIIPLPRD